MKLEISVIGLLIITFYSALVLVVVALPLRKLLAESRWKWAVIAPPVFALLALPWAEEIWIAWHFNQLCKGAGVHVVRQVEVDGFYDSTLRSGYELIRDRGYRFMEHPSLQPGKIGHVERVDNQWKETVIDRPTARYHYKYAYQPTPHQYEEPVGWKIYKTETQVIDAETDEVLGRDTRYTRYSNAFEWLWVRLLGYGTTGCSGPHDQPEKGKRVGQIYQYVLMPKK